MADLLAKMRKAREVAVEVDGRRFTVRRPTDMEAARLANSGDLLDFVVGWDLKEIDLVPGGTPDPVAFDAGLFREWVADRPELWQPLTDAVREAYAAHVRQREDRAKN